MFSITRLLILSLIAQSKSSIKSDFCFVSVDEDERAKYVSALDRYVDACCASILKTVTGRAGRYIKPDFEEATHDAYCGKPDCITSDEKYLPPLFYELADGKLICKYCGQELKTNE